MKRFIYGGLISWLITLLFVGYVMAAEGTAEVVQTPANLVEGQDFQVDVYINPDSTDFYGFSLNLVYDPANVKVVNDGQVLDAGNGAVILDTVIKNTYSLQEGINLFNNTTGNVKFACLRLGETQGVALTTKTLVASIAFRALNTKGLNLRFAPYDTKIHDLSIDSDKYNCLIQLSNSTAAPISYISPDMRCFIATAAYGSYLDPHVASLRDFRDRYLLRSPWGQSFVRYYYNNSPPLASFISQYSGLRTATRIILTPVVFSVVYPVKTTLILTVVGILLLILRKQKQQQVRRAGTAILLLLLFGSWALSINADQAVAVIAPGFTADLNGDTKVDETDLMYLAQYYGLGALTTEDKYDLNQDTVADLYDMVELSINFTPKASPIIISHNESKLDSIPVQWINAAKENLTIYYGHTSHGSQLTTGMQGLIQFKGNLYAFGNVEQAGSLFVDEYSGDLGHNGNTAWANITRDYLKNHPDTNVVMWSWCGGCSDNTEEGINIYLNTMAQLESEYPGVKFVYMTGHLDGSGLGGNLHQRNNQIRNYCKTNDKILYDFEDIESYDPSDVYFGDKYPDDACAYETSPGQRNGNWAIEWQNAHTAGVDWYNCSSAHSQPLNANQKAYAAWWLFARIAGWPGV